LLLLLLLLPLDKANDSTLIKRLLLREELHSRKL
jgi:hypothetical protein